jgi:hypothetical protein
VPSWTTSFPPRWIPTPASSVARASTAWWTVAPAACAEGAPRLRAAEGVSEPCEACKRKSTPRAHVVAHTGRFIHEPTLQRTLDIIHEPTLQRTLGIIHEPTLQRTLGIIHEPTLQRTLGIIQCATAAHTDRTRQDASREMAAMARRLSWVTTCPNKAAAYAITACTDAHACSHARMYSVCEIYSFAQWPTQEI